MRYLWWVKRTLSLVWHDVKNGSARQAAEPLCVRYSINTYKHHFINTSIDQSLCSPDICQLYSPVWQARLLSLAWQLYSHFYWCAESSAACWPPYIYMFLWCCEELDLTPYPLNSSSCPPLSPSQLFLWLWVISCRPLVCYIYTLCVTTDLTADISCWPCVLVIVPIHPGALFF